MPNKFLKTSEMAQMNFEQQPSMEILGEKHVP